MQPSSVQDNNVALLNEVYLNCKMGAAAIDTLLPKVEDTAFATELQNILAQQQSVVLKAATELRNRSTIPSETSTFARAGLWSSIQLHMLTNRQKDHIAEMMIQGDIMGIINLTRAKRTYSGADSDIIELANSVINQEQESIEKMKQYL